MGLFEHWPYVNFHDLNLDWIIKEIPKVFASRDEAKSSAEASAQSAAASQLSADASQASADASADSAEDSQHSAEASQASADASADSAEDAAETVANTLQQISLLQSRVDNIIPSGTQTEGNTELLDIRVGANGIIYPSAGNAVRSQFQDIEKAFDYQFQYLIEANRTNGQYYRQDSDEIVTTEDDFATYAPFYLPAGTYYYHNLNHMFCSVKIGNEIHRLQYYNPDISGSNGSFNLPEGGTVYLTTGKYGWPEPAMLSTSDLSPLYEYRTGMYDIVVKDDSLPDKLNNLSINDISVENVQLSDMYDINGAGVIRYEDGLAIQEYHGTGNSWWEVPVDQTKLVNNFVRLYLDVVSITGLARAYLFGKSTNNNNLYIVLGEFTTAGMHVYDIDLNYYVVYRDLDLSKGIRVGVGSYSNNFICTYSAMDVYNITTVLDTEKSFPENLNTMVNNINANTSAIEALENEGALTSPDGSRFILQVDNNGNINASSVIPQNALFIGNSLLYGFQTFGMCASDNEHDYYHHVTTAITAKKPTATFTKLFGSTFEQCTTQAQVNSWLNDNLLPVLTASLDLVVVQLGDNVNTPEKVNMFTTSCKQLLTFIREHCPKARVAFVASWYSSTQRINIISDACIATGCMFINITDIPADDTRGAVGNVIHRTSEMTTTYEINSFTDDSVNHKLTINFTVGANTYSSVVPYTSYTDNADGSITITGEYTVVTSSGVASHPGNLGMQRIADRILNKLGIE